jgi:hypothetical protein
LKQFNFLLLLQHMGAQVLVQLPRVL